MATRIDSTNRIVPTIGEHIVTNESLASSGIGIRINESTDFRVVVSRLEVIEAGLMVEDVAAVAQGIDIGMRAEGRGGLAVGIVPVAGSNVAVDIHQPDHITLGIGDVIVDVTVLQQHEGRTVLVIEEVQYIVTVSLSDQLAAAILSF